MIDTVHRLHLECRYLRLYRNRKIICQSRFARINGSHAGPAIINDHLAADAQFWLFVFGAHFQTDLNSQTWHTTQPIAVGKRNSGRTRIKSNKSPSEPIPGADTPRFKKKLAPKEAQKPYFQ